MGHLSPSDDDLRAAHEEGRKRMTDAVSRIGIISLTGSSEQAVGGAPGQACEAVPYRPHASYVVLHGCCRYTGSTNPPIGVSECPAGRLCVPG